MTDTFTVGQRGWLAWLDAYPVEVEFLGYGYYEPDYPSDPTRYYRALTEVKRRNNGDDVRVGRIIDESCKQEEVLFATREEAEEVCRKDAAYWLNRKRQELKELEARAGQYGVEYHSCRDPQCRRCEKRPGLYCGDDECNCGAVGNHAACPKVPGCIHGINHGGTCRLAQELHSG